LPPEISKLYRIIALAEKLISASPKPKRGRPVKGKRKRRTGKELVQFRKMLKAERKKGVSVAEFACTHGISSAYIRTLP
jgi:hypothetical protein